MIAPSDEVVIVTERDAILRSTDGGRTFDTTRAGFTARFFRRESDGTIILLAPYGSPGRVLRSYDDGATWLESVMPGTDWYSYAPTPSAAGEILSWSG